jgi:signal transduction histidine kinase
LNSDRNQTDESLRSERARTDRALAARRTAATEHADKVVNRARDNADAVLGVAREQADAVLSAARDRADERVEDSSLPLEPRAIVAAQRVLEDEVLREERKSADESLRREREQGVRALARLLPLEREKTDRYLLTERARSDDAVSNRDDFLGIVSHDLRDLLGGIVTSAALLAKTEEGAKRETQRIERYAARMNRLIADLVDVASIDAGRLAVNPTEGDANALLAEAADTFRAAALAKGVALEAKLFEPALPGRFDHDRLLQVLGNLLSNAIKFTPQGGTVELSGERRGKELRFRVSDTGSGIPRDSLESIFERFWQVGKNDRRGLGLGLYISRCIVEAHGGAIAARSERGGGTSISFTIPQ